MKNKIRSPKQRDRELDKIWDELGRIQEDNNKLLDQVEKQGNLFNEQIDRLNRLIMVQRSESDLEQLTEDAEKLIEDAAKAAAEEKSQQYKNYGTLKSSWPAVPSVA